MAERDQRAPMADSERSKPRTFSATDAQWAAIVSAAEAAGMSRSRYIRSVLAGKTVRSRRSQIEDDLVHSLSRVGNNLNQLTRAANTPGALVSSGRIESVLDEVRECLLRIKESGS